MKTISLQSILSYILILLLVLAVAIQGGAKFRWWNPSPEASISLDDIQQAFPDAYAFSVASDQLIEVRNEAEKVLGYALHSNRLEAHHQGYAGKVPLLIALDPSLRIQTIQLLKNQEDPDFLELVEEMKLLNTWTGQKLDTTLINFPVEAVTGATLSSTAIIHTFRKSIAHYHQVKHQTQITPIRAIQLLIMGILFVLSVVMMIGKKLRSLYTLYLLALLGVAGFWCKTMLSVNTFYNWLTTGLPWQSNIELIVILSFAVLFSILGYRKHYCTYLCPMGAIQILAGKISPFKKRSFNFKISGITLRNIYLSFIWASLILGLTLPLQEMEPFLSFSFQAASWVMIGSGIVIVLLSLFFNRPWCQLCPTGCLLDSIPSLKTHKKNK